MFKRQKEGCKAEPYSPGVLGNPVTFAARWGLPLSKNFVFLARDTASPYVDNRLLLVVGKPELREYKAVYIQTDAEIGLLSDEVVINCAP
jgi:hypothetical protein